MIRFFLKFLWGCFPDGSKKHPKRLPDLLSVARILLYWAWARPVHSAFEYMSSRQDMEKSSRRGILGSIIVFPQNRALYFFSILLVLALAAIPSSPRQYNYRTPMLPVQVHALN